MGAWREGDLVEELLRGDIDDVHRVRRRIRGSDQPFGFAGEDQEVFAPGGCRVGAAILAVGAEALRSRRALSRLRNHLEARPVGVARAGWRERCARAEQGEEECPFHHFLACKEFDVSQKVRGEPLDKHAPCTVGIFVMVNNPCAPRIVVRAMWRQ